MLPGGFTQQFCSHLLHGPVVAARPGRDGVGRRAGIGWPGRPEEVGMLAEDQHTEDVEEPSEADDDVEELLVEEISIDGMCGVY